jgi:hypothetical protein
LELALGHAQWWAEVLAVLTMQVVTTSFGSWFGVAALVTGHLLLKFCT